MPDDELLPRDVVDALAEVLPDYGFEREPPWLAVVEDAAPGGIAASWMRGRELEDPRRIADWTPMEHHGNADGVAVWLDGRIHIGIAGMASRVEWRRTLLTGPQLARAVGAFVVAVDDAAPAVNI